jgi:ubiquinone/menaquinone biosynthesis C-methylase UbiE
MSDLNGRIRDFWDLDAEHYDRSPSHSLSDARESEAWRSALARHLPAPGSRVLDVGAGTGALSLLAAALGYRVTALDFSPPMLERAREKAEARGLLMEFVVGSAVEPPEGPFDAVIERHVLWTQPRPAAALAAWRAAAPAGRLVMYEGFYGQRTLSRRLGSSMAGVIRRVLRVSEAHHAEYDPDVLALLPLANIGSVDPFVQVVRSAGWRRYRIERLREVEAARRRASGPLVGWLESVPQFALLAEA